MSIDAAVRVNSPRIACECIDGEAVLIDFESGTYFSSRDSGAAVLSLLGNGATACQLAEALARQFDASHAQILADVQTFLHELLAAGVAVLCDAPPTSVAPALAVSTNAASQTAWTAPVIETFTDMQQLLLLDPIHEVDDIGWPKLPNAA